MTLRFELAGLRISNESVRQLLTQLEARVSTSIDLSDVLGAALCLPDPKLTRLVQSALPVGFTDADLLGRERVKAAPPASATAYTDQAIAALHEYEQACHQGAVGGLELLLACVAARMSGEERIRWHPLDVDKIARAGSNSRREQERMQNNGPQLGTSFESPVAWEDLTDRVQRANLSGPSPFAGDPVYDAFFDFLTRSLHRSTPRHVLLLRERGVGEQAVLVELAQRGLGAEPAFLRNRRVVRVDCRHLPADQIRAAIESIFANVSSLDELIVCVDGFANLLRSNGFSDNRSLILSLLARARCRVVGIITPHEFEEQLATDADAHDLFSSIHLPEPEMAVAIQLVHHYAAGLQQQYKVLIDSDAIKRTVILSTSYILHDRLPHKAVKVLQSICDDMEYERSQQGSSRAQITEAHVVSKIAEISGIPAETLAGVGEGTDYFKSLSDIIVGQEHAVREVATELGLIKAGLIDPGKPASVMLFVGQTGTGKTEMAKALARMYSSSKRLKTFTLGNFSEPHSVSGLIGVPAGYVGHDQGGRLINELNADPYSVFLLDEADKSHPDVMQPFLNLFDEGWIYDQRGVKAFADRAIFILTTNVGQRQIADMCKQGKSIDEITWTMKESLSKIRHTKSNRPVFTAEFLARIKRIIVFRSLDEGAMTGICRRLVSDLARDWQLKRQKILAVSAGLLDLISRKAYEIDQKSQGKEGGRIVRKLLADFVESPIQSAISASPGEYRACRVVEIAYTMSSGDKLPDAALALLADRVRVKFCVSQ